ncbi:Argonaute/Dicer protein, PAZ [Cynara cardunculus var. scolymus]|uniref:Argonaute/Dicer protein, PAZ n=1 Tax=Cynara cardunculus var. scolymus TaxID=59895 RepID=A0A103YAF2_CYNCS|nr:Argonaute/Dicer protein, PAZ [Cynara cardunculus var. scolymus]
MDSKLQSLTVARRPDSGGSEGTMIALLANHFLVQFDPSQRIYHYDLEISPNPSKDIARLIKQKLVEENSSVLSGVLPAYDGRRNLFSPIEFDKDKLELYINLPIPRNNSPMAANIEDSEEKFKLFRVNIKIVSNLEGKKLRNYLSKGDESVPLPQDYLQALDVVLRENPTENCVLLGRSFYPNLTRKDLGGGAIGVQGFYQSLRPTQQGLALNVDLSVTAFHESIGVIAYLQKRIHSLHDLSERKTRGFSREEKKEAETVLKNIRVFVCHRETTERYQVHSLTDEPAANLQFRDRDGKNLQIVNYFRDQYNYEIQFRNLPCLQTSRRRPCYLPMELCVICEGQKFLRKLSDDQTAKILELGCRKPKERKAIIDGVMAAPFSPSREMTKLSGRILQPPKLKLGDGGNIKDLIPSRHDRQWNLVGSHVFEGTQIARWALVSFGGTGDQKSTIPNFIDRLTRRCEQLGIYLNKKTIISPQFESMQVLNNVNLLESKLKKIQRSASNNLQLLICVMEKKHKGYADLKRISETSIGVMSQCCLYQNLARLSSQFLANLAIKINAKIGGCTVALYTSLPAQIPRLLTLDEPVMFMGADVTHPHPLDDFSPSVAAVVGSVNWPAANKYVSKMRSQTHRQEIIQDLSIMVEEILHDFVRELSKLPKRVIFFRDGVSETQFHKVLRDELQAIRDAFSRFTGYNPPITFAVVQKRHHTRLFPADPVSGAARNQFSDENVPPGTVVDSVITHPKEFDFYLCSHWGVKGTSRPIHYHILRDENEFTSDELQKLVYNLCFTFVRCTKPVSLVPPCYYAHLAAYRGRLYLNQTDRSSGFTRSGSPKTTPLPKLQERVKNLMFYC